MSNWPFVKLERTRLKNHAVLAENWIHDRIAEDPEILGLGTLTTSHRESLGNGLEQLAATCTGSGSSLSLLVQCGATDEAQLVRAIEAWSKTPATTSVLIAENVSQRYLDLIPVLSGAGRLAAIQMEALQFGQQMSVIFTPIGGACNLEAPATETVAVAETGSSETAEEATPAVETCVVEVEELASETTTALCDTETECSSTSETSSEAETETPVAAESSDTQESPSVDRGYWERSAPAGVEMADRLLSITQAIDPSIELTYRPSYMGLARQGGSSDFAKFTPEESGLLLGLSLEPNSLIELSIAQAGLERLQDENECEGYKIRLAAADIEAQRAPVARLIQLAYEESRA